MNLAYVRVSTVVQNEARQIEALKKCNIDEWYVEKTSGKNMDRSELQRMVKHLAKGDIIYIESLSRLGRNTKDLIELVEMLSQKGCQLVSLKESIDTSTPTGKLVFHIFASLAEFERETIKERQAEGIAVALAEGKQYGRPKVEIDQAFISAYKKWRAHQISAVEAMKIAGMKKTTWYARVSEYEV